MCSAVVVTVVAGRHEHLRHQRRLLRSSHRRPDLHVVVALGDPVVAARLAAWHHDDDPPTVVVDASVADPRRLPLAAGRNAGARAALDRGAELLVFLDVDCLPGPNLLDVYVAAARRRPDLVLSGPVTYLPPQNDVEWTATDLFGFRNPHPARPDPPPGVVCDADPDLFWSLNFAVTAQAWRAAGGFDEGYEGYGAEDTDFAHRARERGVGTAWVGGADAYHQHHLTHRPPVQHADAIVRNGARFAGTWGRWPMTGWLHEFEQLGLVRRDGDGWSRAAPVRVLSVPARHPYVEAVRPHRADPVRPDRVQGWELDPALSPTWLRRHATDIDVIHVHFGFERLTAAELAQWLDVARELALPVVVTVHDLRNPHLADNGLHEEHLELLVGSAAAVVTLTEAAARCIEERYGRTARVLAHPTLLTLPAPPCTISDREVLVVLGALRRNVVEPSEIVSAVAAAAEDAGARVRVSVQHGSAADERLAPIRELHDTGALRLDVHERWTDSEVAERVAAAHALVLPYRFGTHSGWIELARDVGTHVVAPSSGCYADQWPAVLTYGNDEGHGLDTASLRSAVRAALGRVAAVAADAVERREQRDYVRAAHEVIYRGVSAS